VIAIVFVVTAMVLLIVALVLFVRGRRDAPRERHCRTAAASCC
jgi:uncharacterized membrane protein